MLEKCEQARVERQDLARGLEDRLHRLVPTVEPARRRALLQVRRDLHNDRMPAADAVAATAAAVGEDARAELLAWSRSLQAEQLQLEAAAEELARELRAVRARLAEVVGSDAFVAGVQLSGKQLHRSALRYLERRRSGAGGRDSKQIRQTESTLLRYACRMALKTSPFGAFTEIGTQPWSRPSPAATDEPMPSPRRSFIRLNRGLLAWMMHTLQRLDGSESLLWLWLDSSVRAHEGRLEGFRRGSDGGPRSYWGEQFVSLRAEGVVAAIAERLQEGPLRRTEVERFVRSRGATEAQASSFVERLAETGVFRQGLPLSDQADHLAGEVAQLLRTVDTPWAASMIAIFDALHRIELELGRASIDARQRMLDDLEQQAVRFGELCGVVAPIEVARTLVFEDVAVEGEARSWDAAPLERSLAHFERLQGLVPLLDEGTLPMLGLHQWFRHHEGVTRHGDDVLSVYRAFVEQSPGEISTIMQGVGSARGDEVRAARARLFAQLRALVTEAGDSEVLALREHCIDGVLGSLPAGLPPAREVAYRVQLMPADDTPAAKIVVNGIAAGHGVFYSRFCDVVEPSVDGAWSLRRSVREAIMRDHPRQADVTASFGLNVNLHPDLAPLEVVYPGSVARRARDRLTLRDLRVEDGPERSSLRLVSRRDGRPVELVPMNFIFPAGAPMLYRFLCALAPLHNVSNDLWRQLRAGHGQRRELERYPRLVLGDLVLARRAWFMPASHLQRLHAGAEIESPRHMRLVERWRRDMGLPRRCFFRVQPSTRGPSSSNWQEQTRRWASLARSARHRKQYLDFRSPLLVRLLLLQVRAEPEGDVMIEECLPSVADQGDAHGPDRAEEFLVELATGPGAAADDP